MKSKKTEIDMDFIGGEGSLTVEEEKALSDFFKQKKLTFKKALVKRHQKKTKRPKVIT
jgi:hypothetical protein